MCRQQFGFLVNALNQLQIRYIANMVAISDECYAVGKQFDQISIGEMQKGRM
jgi:hypothetical protein